MPRTRGYFQPRCWDTCGTLWIMERLMIFRVERGCRVGSRWLRWIDWEFGNTRCDGCRLSKCNWYFNLLRNRGRFLYYLWNIVCGFCICCVRNNEVNDDWNLGTVRVIWWMLVKWHELVCKFLLEIWGGFFMKYPRNESFTYEKLMKNRL